MKMRYLGIALALALYLLPLYFKAWIFFVENLMYAALLLPLAIFLPNPYKEWFKKGGFTLFAVGAVGILGVLLSR
jgi:hypothetical protein